MITRRTALLSSVAVAAAAGAYVRLGLAQPASNGVFEVTRTEEEWLDASAAYEAAQV